MKNLKLSSFLTGFVLAFAITGLFAFTLSNNRNSNMNPQSNNSVITITPDVAKKYRENYIKIFPGAIKGINVSVQQLEALLAAKTAMGSDMNKVSGFRMYYGAETEEPDAPLSSITYPINNQLQQMPAPVELQAATGFPRKYRQDCPPFCD